jgi:hypothetical protein
MTTMQTFLLRFDGRQVKALSSRFNASGDSTVEREIGPRVCAAGYYSKDDFLAVCRWKSPRSQPLCQSNSEEFVRAVTSAALSSECEQFRVESLMLLRGVNWPTASALLHFGCRDPYPVMDWRAVWSAGIDDLPPYAFPFWQGYTEFCRNTARRHRVSMRVLDRALWQYSAENQASGQ